MTTMLRVATSSLARRHGTTLPTLKHLKDPSKFTSSLCRTPLPRRTPFSSSSSSASGGTSGGGGKKGSIPFEPPRIELKPSAGNPLHVQAAKAQALHSELETLLEKQAARRAEEASKPFYHGFFQFVKRSKSEMINIGAAFACVLLAYQIVAMRKAARTLVDRSEEREETMRCLRGKLGDMQTEEFVREMARRCSRAIEDSELGVASSVEQSKKGRVGLFGWGSTSNSTSTVLDDNAARDVDDDDELAAIIRPILLAELRSVVGNSHLSDEQKEEQRLKELTKMMGVDKGTSKAGDLAAKMVPADVSSSSGVLDDTQVVKNTKEGESALGGLEEVLVEATRDSGLVSSSGGSSDGSGATKKRIRYAI